MSLNTVELSINYSQIEDQVAALLHAYGAVPENADILHIEFGAVDDRGVVPLQVQIREEVREVAT